jgi:hypothetical protein
MQIDITYTKQQAEIFFGGLKKFNVIKKGRRFGITRGAAHFFTQKAFEESSLNFLWGETVNANIDRYYDRYFLPLLKKFPSDTWTWNTQKKELKILDSVIDFRSADNPENWEGFGYHYIFLNESGIILKNPYIFDNAVKPMMMDFPDSKLIAAGVPKGRVYRGKTHPFYDLYLSAQADNVNYSLYSFTSYDNPYIDKKEVDLLASTMDDLTRQQEIEGQFVDVVDKPFLYAFKESQHVIESYSPNPHLPLLISFDFNKSPMTCVIGQNINVRKSVIFDEMVMNNGSTIELCQQIKAKYKDWMFNINVTGDASGRNRSPLLVGNVNHYTIIKRELMLKERELMVETKNADHSTSRVLCNSVLQNGEFTITKNCKGTINDLLYANVDDEGTLVKTAENGLHLIDCFRYFIWANYPDFLTKPWLYSRAK